jgi:hypothetical protein
MLLPFISLICHESARSDKKTLWLAHPSPGPHIGVSTTHLGNSLSAAANALPKIKWDFFGAFGVTELKTTRALQGPLGRPPHP